MPPYKSILANSDQEADQSRPTIDVFRAEFERRRRDRAARQAALEAEQAEEDQNLAILEERAQQQALMRGQSVASAVDNGGEPASQESVGKEKIADQISPPRQVIQDQHTWRRSPVSPRRQRSPPPASRVFRYEDDRRFRHRSPVSPRRRRSPPPPPPVPQAFLDYDDRQRQRRYAVPPPPPQQPPPPAPRQRAVKAAKPPPPGMAPEQRPRHLGPTPNSSAAEKFSKDRYGKGYEKRMARQRYADQNPHDLAAQEDVKRMWAQQRKRKERERDRLDQQDELRRKQRQDEEDKEGGGGGVAA